MKNLITVFVSIILIAILSLPVLAANTDYTSKVRFYMQNKDPLFNNSYASTEVTSLTGLTSTYRVINTKTGISTDTGWTYDTSDGYSGINRSDFGGKTYSYASFGSDLRQSYHRISVSDPAGTIGCSGNLTSSTSGYYTWDATTNTCTYSGFV